MKERTNKVKLERIVQTETVRLFSVKKAHDAQLMMSKKIIFEDYLPRRIRFVAGVDVAYSEGMSIGAVAVLNYDTLELAESQTAICETRFPYVPTLLSFREIRPAILCIRRLKVQPDVFLVDGHGFAHPYRCGFASHLGLVLDKSTIGVAKGRLVRDIVEAEASDNVAFIQSDGQNIGAKVATRERRKPVYVSTGHKISLETAVRIVRKCAKDNRIPEPILKAHEIATQTKRKNHILSSLKKINAK